MQINSAKDLDVYNQAYALAMEIFQKSKSWPAEEKYSLTDQIRRSSRSVCANLKEAWSKRVILRILSINLLTATVKTAKQAHGLILLIVAVIFHPKILKGYLNCVGKLAACWVLC